MVRFVASPPLLLLLAVSAILVPGEGTAFAPPPHSTARSRRSASSAVDAAAIRAAKPHSGYGNIIGCDDDRDGDGGSGGRRGSLDRSRRTLLNLPLTLGLTSSGWTAAPRPASANLMQFPCASGTLMNTYHLMRTGESLLEEDDILGTNPLFITNRDAALSDHGIKQVQEACRDMISRGVNPSVVNYSLAAKCIDTANLVATEMMVGRNRIVPEYVLLDPRGVGKWDMTSLSLNEAAIWAMDDAEAGPEGLNGRPPQNDDGTPNETLSNQVTRLRQLMSVLETLYSGDSILLIFPDGTGPALLSALIAGIPLNRVHELEFRPGEVRYDIGADAVLSLLPPSPTAEYAEKINRGRDRLAYLRDHPDAVVSVKEQRLRDELAAAEAKRVETERAREDAQNKREAALAAAKERRRAAERERTEAAEAERQRRLAVERERMEVARAERRRRRGEEEGETIGSAGRQWPGFIPLASLGLVGALATFRPEDVPQLSDGVNSYEDDAPPPVQDGDSPIWEAGAPESDSNPPGTPPVAAEATSRIAVELREMEERIQKAPIDIPEFANIDELKRTGLNVPGRVRVSAGDDDEETISEDDLRSEWDSNVPSHQASKERRTELAKAAMEEYMNRDDGGDAWIGMLSDLMNDEKSE